MKFDAPGARRILFLDHTARMSGGEIALLNLVRHLDRRRFQPVVILFTDGDLAAQLRTASVETHVLTLEQAVADARKDALGPLSLLRGREILESFRFVWRLSREIRRLAPDLVHTNSLKSDVLGGLSGRLAGVPVVWHVRDRIEEDYLPQPVVRAFRLLSRWLPTFVIANSEATLETLRRGTFPRVRGGAIPSGVVPRRGARVVYDGTSGPRGGGSPGEADYPLIGLVGRISPWKGQDVFLRAAALVRRQFPAARFQVIGAALFGEEAYERQVRALCSSLGLDEAVEFTGFRADVSAAIDHLDVLVHASTKPEPFGQVIIEGMAAAKPVVATNAGGVPEIVSDGETGLLVPLGDAEAMAAAVCRLLAQPQWAREMGRRARDKVRDEFSIERTAERVEQVYDTVLRDGRRGRPVRKLVAGGVPSI